MQHYSGKEVNLLDVGGGAGLILKEVSEHLSSKYGVNVKKFAIDLNQKMLRIQKDRNLDTEFLREDIRQTSLKDKQIDLTLFIDVLEHVPNPEEALIELKRISNFVILKVPLENYLIFNIANFLTKGSTRQNQITDFGHINMYSSKKIKRDIKKQMGRICAHRYTNLHNYYKSNNYEKLATVDKAITTIATNVFSISPRLAASLFGDNSILLVKCYDNQ